MSRCKHECGGSIWVTPEYGASRLADAQVCRYCGAWLSLGPANDTPEALVELRAAEVIATRVNARGRLGAEDLAGWDDVVSGWLDYTDDAYDFRAITSPEYQAGWLACAIATHDTHADAESA